jgi:hypothetical protein
MVASGASIAVTRSMAEVSEFTWSSDLPNSNEAMAVVVGSSGLGGCFGFLVRGGRTRFLTAVKGVIASGCAALEIGGMVSLVCCDVACVVSDVDVMVTLACCGRWGGGVDCSVTR